MTVIVIHSSYISFLDSLEAWCRNSVKQSLLHNDICWHSHVLCIAAYISTMQVEHIYNVPASSIGYWYYLHTMVIEWLRCLPECISKASHILRANNTPHSGAAQSLPGLQSVVFTRAKSVSAHFVSCRVTSFKESAEACIRWIFQPVPSRDASLHLIYRQS